MEYAEVLRKRRMVRDYDPERPVPREILDTILRSAIRAPSAGYSQGWDFVVLTEQADRDAYWDVSADPDELDDDWLAGMRKAPVLLLCLSDRTTYLRRYAEPDKGWEDMDEARWPVPYWDIDTGMAALLMLLTAVDEGLGALLFGIAPEHHDAVHEAFAIPTDRTIVAVVSVGYPTEEALRRKPKRSRRQVETVSHDGRFGTPYITLANQT